jgi:hypothetical protein
MRKVPHFALLLAVSLSFILLPAGETLWSKVLNIAGTLNTGPFQLPGPEGCTPGFWKQPHHLDQWQGYDPEEEFDTVFGVESSTHPSLLEALETGGGGESALLRHAVAALLNAAHEDVNYLYSIVEIIEIVANAFATGEFEDAKDILEAANESECELPKGSEVELESLPIGTPSATPTPELTQDGACTSTVWTNVELWPDPYLPEQLFSEAFEVDMPDSPNLGEALLLEGEGLEALIRESTAALLNAASPKVEFELTTEQVISYFQATIATDDLEVIGATALLLQEINDGECPLPEVEAQPTSTETPTPTATSSPKKQGSPTETPTPTPTDTPTATGTDTPAPTSTDTPEPTSTDTPEPTATDTSEPTATDTPEPTSTDTPEPTPTDTPEPAPSDTPEPTPTP